MPKRSYPFSESFSSQYKVHVGLKEINNCGVFGLKYRQEIYEKTKNLLFNGTKAMMGRIWKADGEEKASDALVSDQTAVSPAPGHQTLLKGQTRIGLDGRLQKASAAPGCAAAPTACCVCQRVSGSRKPCSQFIVSVTSVSSAVAVHPDSSDHNRRVLRRLTVMMPDIIFNALPITCK
ncbi:Apoptosis regulatory protein Siva [Labeo rohita]|uniref:Apoptosis regulatory protein Siva n=1 Tax=Labeo rohita TaxID=84645 RepID=A0ABQ8LVN0_LABRO|nr:Apoptosis regulatory protein Siva [Labeo rohita]